MDPGKIVVCAGVFLLAVGVKIRESVLGVGFLRVRPGGFAVTFFPFFFKKKIFK